MNHSSIVIFHSSSFVFLFYLSFPFLESFSSLFFFSSMSSRSKTRSRSPSPARSVVPSFKKPKKHIPSIQESSGPEINENTRDSFYDVDEEKTFPSLPNLEEGTIPFSQPQGVEDLLPPQEKKQE